MSTLREQTPEANHVAHEDRHPYARHVGLLIRYLPVGGIQKIIVRLANEFAERGYRVDLILAKGKGAMAGNVAPGVRVIDLGKRRVWRALPALVRYVQSEAPDVLFAAEAPVNLVAIWAKLLSRRQIRLVISVRSNMTHYARGGETWYGRFIPTMIKLFFPFADRVVAVSHGVLEDLHTISPRAASKGSVLYNPVVDDSLADAAAQPVQHQWFENREVPILIAVGRLTRQKNFDLLVRAFWRLRREIDARLIILGDGNQREALESEIKALGLEDSIYLPGFVANPYPYMANASLFVLSSDFEGFGSVLVEALACGCPVVSTDCPSGPREILEDGKWGRLVPVGDEKALAEAIQHSLVERPDSDQLRRRAMYFSVEKAIDRYLNVLLEDVHSTRHMGR